MIQSIFSQRDRFLDTEDHQRRVFDTIEDMISISIDSEDWINHLETGLKRPLTKRKKVRTIEFIQQCQEHYFESNYALYSLASRCKRIFENINGQEHEELEWAIEIKNKIMEKIARLEHRYTLNAPRSPQVKISEQLKVLYDLLNEIEKCLTKFDPR